MKLAHAALSATAVGLFLLRGPDSCSTIDPPTGPATTPTVAVTPGPIGAQAQSPNGDVTAVCDATGHAVTVSPDTPAARAEGNRLCAADARDQKLIQSVINQIDPPPSH